MLSILTTSESLDIKRKRDNLITSKSLDIECAESVLLEVNIHSSTGVKSV